MTLWGWFGLGVLYLLPGMTLWWVAVFSARKEDRLKIGWGEALSITVFCGIAWPMLLLAAVIAALAHRGKP